jgi:predicted acyl esterase
MKKPICAWGAGAAGLVAVLLLAVPVRSPAATPDQNKLPAGARIGNYVGEDVMIPMRDGVKLHAEVWRPEGVAAHNGAFRLQYGWEYAAALETDGRTLNAFDYEKQDPYTWPLGQDHLASLDQRSLKHTLPSWQNFAVRY